MREIPTLRMHHPRVSPTRWAPATATMLCTHHAAVHHAGGDRRRSAPCARPPSSIHHDILHALLAHLFRDHLRHPVAAHITRTRRPTLNLRNRSKHRWQAALQKRPPHKHLIVPPAPPLQIQREHRARVRVARAAPPITMQHIEPPHRFASAPTNPSASSQTHAAFRHAAMAGAA